MSDKLPHVTVPEWIPDVLRYGVIGLILPPGIGKFLTYEQSVQLFIGLGIPSPGITVLVVGMIELGAVVLLLFNTARWIGAVVLIPVMIVAFLTAGDWQAVAVLGAVVGLLGVELNLIVADREKEG